MDWRALVRASTAAGFAAAMAYGIWRVEWFDVFRWGTPGPRLLLVYACYVGGFGTIGWFLAALLTLRPDPPRAPSPIGVISKRHQI